MTSITTLISVFFTSISFLVPALLFLINFRLRANRFPKSLKWIGLREEMFSKTRACFRQHNNGLQDITDGYAKFSRQGQSFVLPDTSLQPQIMLPQEHIRWLMAQPETVLSRRDVQQEKFAARYIIPEIEKSLDALIVNVVRRDVTRFIGKSQADVFDELRQSVDATLGIDEVGWQRVCLFEAMQAIISRSTNRMVIGLPLCRDLNYLHSSNIYSTLLGSTMAIAGQVVPWFLRIPVAFLFRLPTYVYKQRSLKKLIPRVKHLMEEVKQERETQSVRSAGSNNFLGWLTEALLDSEHVGRCKPEWVANYVLGLGTATSHATIISGMNVFLDLLSSDPKLGYYERLRAEAAATFKTEKDWEESATVGRLSFTDSAIRESLRKNPILTKGLMREVMPEGGLTLPDGHQISQGAWIGVSVSGINTDERFYPKPQAYEPFRFVRDTADKDVSEQESINGVAEKQKIISLATTTDTFLTWEHGRHACPGRWFAASFLKLMVAYITLNYDIRPMEKRPQNIIVGDSIVPSYSAAIEVRRRKHV